MSHLDHLLYKMHSTLRLNFTTVLSLTSIVNRQTARTLYDLFYGVPPMHPTDLLPSSVQPERSNTVGSSYKVF
jgi:hypothetical protein